MASRSSGFSQGEIRELIKSLERQGGRVEWRDSKNAKNVEGRYPAKVFAPDVRDGFVLIHGTPSGSLLLRNDVIKAGFLWPFDDKKATKAAEKMTSRKENELSSVKVTSSADHKRKAGEHLMVPPGARNRKGNPSKSSADAFRPVVAELPDTFWTDQAWDIARAKNVPGYGATKGGSSLQRVQGMLDWMGCRVVETKPNRGGYSYRWKKELAERTDYGSGNVTNLTRVPDQPKVEFEAPKETTPVLPATPGPIAAAFAEAEKKKRERAECVECGKHFTPEGLERHIEDTQHGEPKTPIKLDPKHPLVQEAIASTKLDGETFSVGEASPLNEELGQLLRRDEAMQKLNAVSREDYDTLEQMAQQIEDKLAAALHANEELAANLVKSQRAADGAEADRDRIQGELFAAQENLAAVTRHSLALESDVERAEQDLTDARIAARKTEDDGSWVLDQEPLRFATLQDVVADAAKFGIVVEIRGRRA